jgi:hypothetical protein
MCMIIISDRWKSEGVCMRLLRYMRDTFLELDTTLDDELVRGKINKLISLHTVGVSKLKCTQCSMDQVPPWLHAERSGQRPEDHGADDR